MSSRFKCLVQINDLKYCVVIESDNSYFTFKSVYEQILSQTRQNVSPETHLFEVFDTDFKEYVLIISDKQIIENLSRIRVLLKTSNDHEDISFSSISPAKGPIISESNAINNNCSKVVKISSTIDSTNSITSSNITFKDINNLDKTSPDINSKPVKKLNDICDQFSESANNISETISVSAKPKTLNNEKVIVKEVKKSLNNESIIYSSKPELVSNSNSGYSEDTNSHLNSITDYLGVRNLKCGHLSTSSQLVFEVKTEKIGNILTIALKYSSVDIEAFKKLLQIMDINRYLFKMNPSNDMELNSKWIIVSNEMIRNGFTSWKPQKCRDSFMGSINWYKKVLENAPNYEVASKVYPLFDVVHSLDLEYFLKVGKFESVSELRKLFALKSAKYKETIGSNQKKTEMPTINSSNNRSYISAHALTSKDYYQSRDKLDISIVSEVSSGQDWCQFIEKASKLTDSDVKAFYSLAKIVERVVTQFGSNSKSFWQLVSNEMKANGYKDFNAKKCENKYLNYVCDYYKLALINSPDYKTASSVYPLFDLIHAMDLRQTLSSHSFQKINRLREQFDHKLALNRSKINK